MDPLEELTISYNGNPKVVYNLAPKTADDNMEGDGNILQGCGLV